jgi:hypothetical protein
MEMEAAAAKPMYDLAISRASGKCACGCRLPVTVVVYLNQAKALTDLSKAKTKTEKLGPEITVMNVE